MITPTTDLVRDATTAAVYWKQTWTADWALAPYVWVRQIEWCASPKVSSALLQWEYGVGARQGRPVETVARLAVEGWWVKILLSQGDDPPLTWIGQVAEVQEIRVGAPKLQMLLCYGPEALLDRLVVTRSWFDDGTGGEWCVDRGLAFNPEPKAGEDQEGNRSPDFGTKGSYVFAGPNIGDLAAAEAWSTRDVVKYLTTYHALLDGAGNEVLALHLLEPHGMLYLPRFDRPRIETHGRTLKSLLDAAMDSRKGLGYYTYIDENANQIRIRPFTYLDEQITLPSGNVLEANAAQESLDFEAALDIIDGRITNAAAQKYHRVRAVGSRPVVCCSATLAQNYFGDDPTMLADWDADTETAYEAACSGEAWYAALPIAEQQQRNADYRAQEKFERVYSWFRARDNWPDYDHGQTWETSIPTAIWEKFTGNPDGADAEPLEQRLVYCPELRLLEQLPLRVDTDYSVDPPTDNTPDNTAIEYMPPFGVIELADDLPSTEGKYALLDKLAACAGIERTGPGFGRAFSCTLVMRRDAAGLAIKVAGMPQHVLAHGAEALRLFTSTEPSDVAEAKDIPDYDMDTILVTVAFELDCLFSAVYPSTVAAVGEPLRERIVEVPRCRYEYLAGKTVLGVDPEGDLIEAPADGIVLRDDTGDLEDVARLAYEWWGKTRQAFTLTWSQAVNASLFPIGTLITEIGSGATAEEVRTVITSVKVTLSQNAETEPHTTTIRTQWAEVDVASWLDAPMPPAYEATLDQRSLAHRYDELYPGARIDFGAEEGRS